MLTEAEMKAEFFKCDEFFGYIAGSFNPDPNYWLPNKLDAAEIAELTKLNGLLKARDQSIWQFEFKDKSSLGGPEVPDFTDFASWEELLKYMIYYPKKAELDLVKNVAYDISRLSACHVSCDLIDDDCQSTVYFYDHIIIGWHSNDEQRFLFKNFQSVA